MVKITLNKEPNLVSSCVQDPMRRMKVTIGCLYKSAEKSEIVLPKRL